MFALAARRFELRGWRCGAVGATALLLGMGVYTVMRPSWQPGAADWLVGVLGVSPSFYHVLAFVLLTQTFAKRTSTSAARIGVVWVAINVVFELGQHAAIAAPLDRGVAALCDLALCRRIGGYFVYGTFDPGDLLASVVGAVCAWGLLQIGSGNRVSLGDNA